MEVKDILDIETIKVNMQANSKEEAIEELSNILLENEYITNIEEFITDIYARESEGKTGIGNYIAIPHGKSNSVKKIGVAIGVTKKEIPWETLDGKGVKGIILFAVGNDNDGAYNHLKILSLFAKRLGNDEVIEEFLRATDAQEVKKALAN